MKYYKLLNGKNRDYLAGTKAISTDYKFPISKWDFESASILHELPAKDVALLLANSTEHIYNKDELIFRENASPSGIFYIKEGKVKKYKADRDGKEHIIYIAKCGELIGYHAVLAEDRFPDTAAPLEKSRIVFIPKEDFLTAIHQSEVLGGRLLKTLSHEFAVLINGLSIFAQRSVRERLALQLIVLSEKYKKGFGADTSVEINISRTDLANLVGTARENVVRLLSEFKKEHLITTRGRIIIPSSIARLIRIAHFE